MSLPRSDHRKRMGSGTGKKLHATIVLHDTVVVEESESEVEDFNDKEPASDCESSYVTCNNGSTCNDIFENSQEEISVEDTTMLEDVPETEPSEEKEQGAEVGEVTSSMETLKIEEKFDLQQVEKHTWTLPNFKRDLANYLDDEYKDGTTRYPIRTLLMKNGHNIGLPTVFLANLFMREWSDENENVGQANRNLEKEAEQGKGKEGDIFVQIRIKVVEAPTVEPYVNAHYKMMVHTVPNGTIASVWTPIFPHSLKFTARNSVKMRWNLVKPKMSLEDSLCISIEHYVYRKPIEWGLNPKEVTVMKKFIDQSIGRKDKEVIESIITKCKKEGLNAVAEALYGRVTRIDD